MPGAETGGRANLAVAFVANEFVTEANWFGGLAAYLDKITHALLARGHRVEVFTQSHVSGVVDHGGVTVHRVATPLHNRLYRGARRALLPTQGLRRDADLAVRSLCLSRALARRQAEMPFDVVQVASYLAVGLALPSGSRAPFATVSRLSSIEHLYGNPDMAWDPEEAPHDLEWRALRRTDGVFGPSATMNAYAGKWLSRRVDTIASPFVPLAAGGSRRRGAPLVTFAGKLTMTKGIDRFCEMARRLLDRTDATFAVCGHLDPADTGVGAEIEALRQAGDGRVTIAGNLGRADLGRMLAASDVVVLPSRVDNLPNVALEALGCGAAVVASRGIGMEQLGLGGDAGRVVDAGDADALAGAVVAFLGVGGREARARAARKVVSGLGPSEVAASHEALYVRVLAERAAAAAGGRSDAVRHA